MILGISYWYELGYRLGNIDDPIITSAEEWWQVFKDQGGADDLQEKEAFVMGWLDARGDKE